MARATNGELVAYAQRCLSDALQRGEAPIASHLLLTQVLDDKCAIQREQGITAGVAWVRRADLVAVYRDYGVSMGMQRGMDRARACGVPIEYREIG